MASTADAILTWYEYEYPTFSQDDYYVEMGWPYSEFTSRFWLHTDVTLKCKFRVTYNERTESFARTLVASWWYKIEHYCRQQPDYDPTTWYKAYTQVYMFIANYYDTYTKWEDNPLGNKWSYIAYPTIGGNLIPFEDDDFCYDRAWHYSILWPELDPPGDPDNDGITNWIFPNV